MKKLMHFIKLKITLWLEKMAKVNKENFGDNELTCCSLKDKNISKKIN